MPRKPSVGGATPADGDNTPTRMGGGYRFTVKGWRILKTDSGVMTRCGRATQCAACRLNGCGTGRCGLDEVPATDERIVDGANAVLGPIQAHALPLDAESQRADQ